MESQFLQQMTGSSAGNVLSALVVFIGWILHRKCRHSKCVGHSFCCDIEINDDESTEGGDLENQLRKEIEKEVYELYESEHKCIPGSD